MNDILERTGFDANYIMVQPFSLAIHGGAGTLVKYQMTAEKESDYRAALQLALDFGFTLL